MLAFCIISSRGATEYSSGCKPVGIRENILSADDADVRRCTQIKKEVSRTKARRARRREEFLSVFDLLDGAILCQARLVFKVIHWNIKS